MSSPALVIPERIEEAPALEGSVPVPLVHKEIAGSTEDLRIVKHSLVVQEGLDVNTINDPADVQLQPEETSEACLIMWEGDETVQLPSTKPSDTPVQAETVDTSMNKEAALTEDCPIVVDSEEMILEPPVQSSETPDDAAFELVPSPALLKEQKDTVKIMLHGITHTLTNGNLNQLSNYGRVANNIFGMNWEQLDIRPLRAIFDERFAYLESLKDLSGLSPIGLFQQEVGQRLTSLRGQLAVRRQELDVLVTAQNETLTVLLMLQGSIDKTHSTFGAAL
ncbi:hypothetical protein MRB53_026004 [Persea americana]|uniref:Uncharacterized protein n=1 Tax=Persea americana TaxID=3435 RepID=A0ACC2LHS0_PERAE|nr:hypothetical protein MRB53_026004 [Persea americana]